MRLFRHVGAAFLSLLVLVVSAHAFADPVFKVGFGKRDVTPVKPLPMWGYGARHAALSVGVMDPLYAKATVIDVGTAKLALVGLDLGRSPTSKSMAVIREAVKKNSGVDTVMIVGSHTHSGPVIELLDEPGKGKGKFDDAVAYVKQLETGIIDAIAEAAAHTQDAKIGWDSAKVPMNRNRQAKKAPKVTDPELSVVRFDDTSGKPIALMVNFAGHPVTRDPADLRFSADYPGQMMNAVEAELKTNCFFMQGSAGDMSINPPQGVNGTEGFGKALSAEVLKINKEIVTAVPASPSIKAMEEDFAFTLRVDFTNPLTVMTFGQAFFPELATAFAGDLSDNKLRPHLTTVLLNGQLAPGRGVRRVLLPAFATPERAQPGRENAVLWILQRPSYVFPHDRSGGRRRLRGVTHSVVGRTRRSGDDDGPCFDRRLHDAGRLSKELTLVAVWGDTRRIAWLVRVGSARVLFFRFVHQPVGVEEILPRTVR